MQNVQFEEKGSTWKCNGLSPMLKEIRGFKKSLKLNGIKGVVASRQAGQLDSFGHVVLALE